MINSINSEGEEEDEEFFPARSNIIIDGAEWITEKEDFPPILKSSCCSNGNVKILNTTNIMPNETSNSPYFEAPRMSSKAESEPIRFVSPVIQSNTIDKKQNVNIEQENRIFGESAGSILDELLPTQVQPFRGVGLMGNNNDDRYAKYNDKFFSSLFKLSFLLWGCCALVLFLSSSTDSKIPGTGTLYKAIGETCGWFGILLAVGLALSAVWAKVLAERTETIVYGLMLAVPAGFAGLAIFSMSNLGGIFGFITIGCLFLFSGISGLIIWLNRKNLEITVEVVRTAAIFVQATPQLYGLVGRTVAVYGVFVLVWMLSFAKLLQMKWVMWSFVLQLFYVFMLLWTGVVLSTMQKFVIGSWVRGWMDQVEDGSERIVDESSTGVFTEEFGTVCLASGILAVARLIRLCAKVAHLTLTSVVDSKYGPISWMSRWMLSMIGLMERLVERYTDFSIYYIAINKSGSGNDNDNEGDVSITFWEGCSAVGRILQRHSILLITTDFTAQMLLKFSTILIGFISSALLYIFAHKYMTWTSGLLMVFLTASLTDFVASVYTAAIDASFLCYLSDLERVEKAGKIDGQIHSAFSAKLIHV